MTGRHSGSGGRTRFRAAGLYRLPVRPRRPRRGDALFIVGAIDWSIFAILARAWRVEPVRGTALVAVISLIGYVPIHFALLPSKFATAPLIDIAGQAVYQGFLSMVISLLLFTRAVGALGASLTTMITAFVPVTAALSALIILGEPLTVFTVAAIVLVTIGMFGAVSGGRANIPVFAPAIPPAPTAASSGEKPQ